MKSLFSKVAIILLISLLAMNTVVMAGDGDGSGGGKDQPLKLVNSTIEDGEKDVALNAEIKLELSKNVTFDSVRAGNQKAFSMVDKEGNPVDINVILAESTNRDERNFVTIEVKKDLKKDQQYTLKIDENLKSKSGSTLKKPIEITFTTIDNAGSADNPKTSDNISIYVVISLGIVLLLAYKGFGMHKEKAQ